MHVSKESKRIVKYPVINRRDAVIFKIKFNHPNAVYDVVCPAALRNWGVPWHCAFAFVRRRALESVTFHDSRRVFGGCAHRNPFRHVRVETAWVTRHASSAEERRDRYPRHKDCEPIGFQSFVYVRNL